jgi:Flp pilus assembly pilin Flp
MARRDKEEAEMRSIVRRLVRGSGGSTAIEYALIAALIGLAIIAGALLLGGALEDLYIGFGSQPAINQ